MELQNTTPKLDTIAGARYRLFGTIGDYLNAVTHNWLVQVPSANPAILEMYHDRDRKPGRDLLPHFAEYAGKYLTGATEVLRLTGDPGLNDVSDSFVTSLLACQAKDGYLGIFPREVRLENRLPDGQSNYLNGQTWDTWGHYHNCVGLLKWYELSGQRRALSAARRIADLLCERYLGAPPGRRLVDSGVVDKYGWSGTHANLAPVHSLAILHRRTGEKRYLDLSLQLTREFEITPHGGGYIRTALQGKDFYQTPRPRWESLHAVMALPELYWITGREDFRRAYEHIWWNLVKLERHNNGGFSSDEQARGDPYHQGAIETCCNVAWLALSVEMLRLSGASVVADELELTTLNSVIGYFPVSGRWCTYNTPMDGVRRAFVAEHNWQARPGAAELNCCSVNAARGLGLIGEWALMQDDEGLVVNYFGPSEMEARLASGPTVRLTQETAYPRHGQVRLVVSPSHQARFALKIRIPHWSKKTRVGVNGDRVKDLTPGRYLRLERTWEKGDRVDLHLDLSPHFWVGARACQGRTSIYRGPVLLAVDAHDNEFHLDSAPALNAHSLGLRSSRRRPRVKAMVLMEARGVDGQQVRLRDFGTSGEAGTPYRSWLRVGGAPKMRFSRNNPLRSGRL
jgi:DUF1680 family protein